MASAYDILRAAWTNPTQPPPGVTGTALTAGMTTQQKIDAVNAWTVPAAAMSIIVPSYAIYNLIALADFTALTATNQALIRDLYNLGMVNMSIGSMARARFQAIFPSGTTRNNFNAMVASYDVPMVSWLQANGYPPLTSAMLATDAANLT